MSILAFFYILRNNGIKITPKEWFDLYKLLELGLINSLNDLYYQGRKVLVKSEKLYDAYDKAYLEFINEGANLSKNLDRILSFMDEIKPLKKLFAENELELDEIIKRFNERLLNQKEKHQGGGRHIGQYGYSPFGSFGQARDGIRVGGESFNHRAFFVAGERKFKNLREDNYLDSRNIGVSLKKLRHFQETGREDEIDLENTIDKTAKNFGDIEIVFKKERKNNVKLLLLIDNGGSMDIYTELVEKLFSVAKSLNYFKEFKHLYFHNCIYDYVYEDMELWDKLPTDRIFKDYNSDWKVIFIGDALMSPYELYNSWQMIYRYERKGMQGYEWLDMLRKHFKNAIWLNPIPKIQWQHQTVKAISKLFRMYPITAEGIENGVKELLKGN